MTDVFERALAQRAMENPSVNILQAQWDFDKRLLSSALQSVGNMFPHYSRHDASHSHSILIQIERVLGPERISILSATDLWLMLESAYLHDSGMIVTNAELEELWRDRVFQDFLQNLTLHSDPDISDAAQMLLVDGPQDRNNFSPRVDPSWPIRIVRAVRMVVAEYRRREHAAKSAKVVVDPTSIGIASPRTGLIQERLFHLLGRVCSAHAESFTKVMDLPYSESGVASDQAHPRFVACMLRLGDLLDLDNGRFCPVMLETFGSLPASSTAHLAKHSAITHLRIDTRTIEVRAECDADSVLSGGYEVCATWFDMLRSELRLQQAAWTKIAPFDDFGSLPSEGDIEVRCESLISHGHVELAPDRVHRFLEGSSLYDGFESFVRELVQNATDATLVRAWLEHADSLRSPADTESVLSKYPIDVSFNRIKSESLNRARWKLAVRDRGIGFSSGDVEDLRHVGSQHGDQSKRRVVSRMPEWLRPSGSFGIGMQSLFLVTDRVRIETRSFFSGESLEVELVAAKGLRPRVLSKPASVEIPLPFGSVVEFIVEFEAVPPQFRYPMGEQRVSNVLENFDFLVDEELPIEAAKITQKLFDVGASSWAHVRINGETAQETVPPKQWHFDGETGINVHLNYVPVESISGRCFLRYRGADVTTSLDAPAFYGAVADIQSGSADEVLTLNREKLKSTTESKTRRRVRLATHRALVVRIESLRATTMPSDELRNASLALFISGIPEAVDNAGVEWKECPVGSGTSARTLQSFDSTTISQVSIRETGERDNLDSLASARIDQNDTSITITTGSTRIAAVLGYTLRHLGFTYQQLAHLEKGKQGDQRTVNYYRCKPVDVYVDPTLLAKVLSRAQRTARIGSRRTIPCPNRFEMLQLKGDPEGFYVGIESEIGPRLLLPFVIREHGKVAISGLSELVTFLERSTGNARNDIIDSLIGLIRHIDELMSGDSQWLENKIYDLAAAEASLRELRNNVGMAP